MTGSNIDDAEPPVAQSDSLVDENSLVIRTTMSDHVAHAFEHAGVDATSRPAGKRNPVNSAHIFLILRLSSSRSIQRAHATLQFFPRQSEASSRQAKPIPRESDCFRQTLTKCTRNLKSPKRFAPLQCCRYHELSARRGCFRYAPESRSRQLPRVVQ